MNTEIDENIELGNDIFKISTQIDNLIDTNYNVDVMKSLIDKIEQTTKKLTIAKLINIAELVLDLHKEEIKLTKNFLFVFVDENENKVLKHEFEELAKNNKKNTKIIIVAKSNTKYTELAKLCKITSLPAISHIIYETKEIHKYEGKMEITDIIKQYDL